jgi:hypothetical protein
MCIWNGIYKPPDFIRLGCFYVKPYGRLLIMEKNTIGNGCIKVSDISEVHDHLLTGNMNQSCVKDHGFSSRCSSKPFLELGILPFAPPVIKGNICPK